MSKPYKAQGDWNLIKPDGSVLMFHGVFERDSILKLLNEAHELGASSPIVGEPVLTVDQAIQVLEEWGSFRQQDEWIKFMRPRFQAKASAQAPQSSPAPQGVTVDQIEDLLEECTDMHGEVYRDRFKKGLSALLTK